MDWVREKKINLLVQTEPKSNDPELTGVPSVQELARNENDRRVIDLVVAGDAMGKPMAIAPNAPPERAQALRAAYEATLRDPDFIKARAPQGRPQCRAGRAAAGDRGAGAVDAGRPQGPRP